MHRGNSRFIRLPAGAVREHAKCFRRLALLPTTVSSKTVRRKDRVSEFPRTECEPVARASIAACHSTAECSGFGSLVV
jgi:hypothetical protein